MCLINGFLLLLYEQYRIQIAYIYKSKLQCNINRCRLFLQTPNGAIIQDGKSFIIQNQAQFAREILPLNYKHNNMASFIRQLNMCKFLTRNHISHNFFCRCMRFYNWSLLFFSLSIFHFIHSIIIQTAFIK